MDYLQLIDSLTPQTYQRLAQAVELGRWPDGSLLTATQRAHALQAIIAWGERHLPPEQRIGFIDSAGREREPCEPPTTTPLRFVD